MFVLITIILIIIIRYIVFSITKFTLYVCIYADFILSRKKLVVQKYHTSIFIVSFLFVQDFSLILAYMLEVYHNF